MNRSKGPSPQRVAAMKMMKDDDVRMRNVVDAVLKDENGRELIGWLFLRCGYNKSSFVVDPTTFEVRADSIIHNEARRRVYIELRNLATGSLLAPVEEAAEARQRAEVEKTGTEDV